MKYNKYIITSWFTIMGGVKGALAYIRDTQCSCTDKRFHELSTVAMGH